MRQLCGLLLFMALSATPGAAQLTPFAREPSAAIIAGPRILVRAERAIGFGAPGDTAEVTFRCPAGGQLVQVTHDDKRRGSYRENGQWRDITFNGNVFAPSLSFTLQTIDVHGQQIRCRYRTTSGWSALYIYTVNRQVISCAPQWNDSRTCWLKDP